MHTKDIVKIVGIGLLFAVLIIGYVYFNEQSKLATGKTRANIVVQSLSDNDVESIDADLEAVIGDEPTRSQLEGLERARVSMDFVLEQLESGEELEFSADEMKRMQGVDVYAASYSFGAPQGGEDYLIVTLRRIENQWVLGNLQLAAVDPFEKRN